MAVLARLAIGFMAIVLTPVWVPLYLVFDFTYYVGDTVLEIVREAMESRRSRRENRRN